MNATYPARLSDTHSQYEQDEFIVEISLFEEFEDEDDGELLRESDDQPLLH